MRRSALVLFVFLTASAWLVAPCPGGEPPKSDRELAGLKGAVQKVVYTDWGDGETYDREGNLVKKDTAGGNCLISDVYSPGTDGADGRTVKRFIYDSSNSAMCTLLHKDLPREKDDSINYKIRLYAGYVSFENSASYEWVADESAVFGKTYSWRKRRYYDQFSRVIEELYTDAALVVRTTLYKYEGNETDPVSAEFLNNNRYSYREWYKYEGHDGQGNWTKRTVTRVEPASRGGSGDIKRAITYY